MFGGMYTEAAMQTEHFHGFFVGSNVFKMTTGNCTTGIPDANAGNFLADQHTLFFWNNNTVCEGRDGLSWFELERPHQNGSNDFAVQMIAPPIAFAYNNMAWWGTTQPNCPGFGFQHAVRPMDRLNFGPNVFFTGQYNPSATNISIAFGNDGFGSCNTGLNRTSQHAMYSGMMPVEAKMGGWTPGNFIGTSTRPYDTGNFYATSGSPAVSAAAAPPYPMSLYPLIYNALSSTATMTRRTQVDANNFPTTIGPGDAAGAPTLTSIVATPNPANVTYPATIQLTATCTFSDSSVTNCTNTATWSNNGSTHFHMDSVTKGLVDTDSVGSGDVATATIGALSSNTTVNVLALAGQSVKIGSGVRIGSGAGSGTVRVNH
jgi:hypothetical protein